MGKRINYYKYAFRCDGIEAFMEIEIKNELIMSKRIAELCEEFRHCKLEDIATIAFNEFGGKVKVKATYNKVKVKAIRS